MVKCNKSNGIVALLPHRFLTIKTEDVSKKSPKIAELIKDCQGNHDPRYLGYFKCFQNQLYYDAHDVLEDLWLEDKKSPDQLYYKGLIQAAGAFVHLKLHYEYPHHSVHGARLHPAGRLLTLARKNLEGYAPHHLDFWVDEFILLLDSYACRLKQGHYKLNPWSPENPPQIAPPGTC